MLITWSEVFEYTGGITVTMITFYFLYPIYINYRKWECKRECLKAQKKYEQWYCENKNNPNALHSIAANNLELELLAIKESVPGGLDFEKECRTALMVIIMTFMGLVLAHFGISGGGTRFGWDD